MRDEIELAPAVTDAAGAQDLFDGRQQAVAILQHDAVELLALGFIHRARLQRFEIQPDGGDRSFQFMCDGVDEGVVLLIAADFADQEDGIQHDAADDHRQQQDPRTSRMPVRQLSNTQPM